MTVQMFKLSITQHVECLNSNSALSV
uniref:Uncharacterized protein n=1 Tax=Anguilla anguilla TaxID=7936 RepID=A0A0E9XUE4_ANGAN